MRGPEKSFKSIARFAYLLVGLDNGHKNVVPEGHEALDNVSEGLGDGELRVGDTIVLLLIAGVELVALLHGGRRGGIGAAPDEHL